jgi:hypothetical protein
LHLISASDFLHPRSAPLVLQDVKSGFFVMENRRSFKKNRQANNSGFHLRFIAKIEANGAPGNALTAPEDRRLAPDHRCAKPLARDAPRAETSPTAPLEASTGRRRRARSKNKRR